MKFALIIIAAAFIIIASPSASNAQDFPAVEKFSAPKYPAAALAVRAEGEVSLLALVDENGSVESVTATSGHPLLQKVAELNVKEWQFSKLRGNHYIVVRVRFRILDPKRKTALKLTGYTLDFGYPPMRIIQTLSYNNSAES